MFNESHSYYFALTDTTTDDFTPATPTQATGNNDSATTMSMCSLHSMVKCLFYYDMFAAPHTEINVLAIVLTCIGTVFVMFVFVVIGLCSVYWYRRSVRRNRGRYSCIHNVFTI